MQHWQEYRVCRLIRIIGKFSGFISQCYLNFLFASWILPCVVEAMRLLDVSSTFVPSFSLFIHRHFIEPLMRRLMAPTYFEGNIPDPLFVRGQEAAEKLGCFFLLLAKLDWFCSRSLFIISPSPCRVGDFFTSGLPICHIFAFLSHFELGMQE